MFLRSCSALAALALAVGCSQPQDHASDTSIVDVDHTAVERQAIGNCWLYAHATWIESMHLTATGEELDVSQSYWTYFHWLDQITPSRTEISTGGWYSTAARIVSSYGLVDELQFVPEDTEKEMSARQSEALATMNHHLKHGRLASARARGDRALVRAVLDDAWRLSPEVRAWLDQAFGPALDRTFANGRATPEGTPVIRDDQLAVAYATRDRRGDVTLATKTLRDAQAEWRVVNYPSWGGQRARRDLLLRAQRALHARQPVLISWAVDFYALENDDPELVGSFNLTTLARRGQPGTQGYHMTVLEDYEAVTREFGVLKAGITLDPSDPVDQAKLDAALRPDTEIVLLRTKNSWGSERPDRNFVPGFPGYHDLRMDYLDGPITWCTKSDVGDGTPQQRGCNQSVTPLSEIILPPGF